ncbi:MAG: hypothetical protein HC880_05320 [Bacteroidia bacterium]|nr:hypothetical protein [Bacteroidia bacterium]
MPFLFFILLELGLRAFGYGTSYPVFIEDESGQYKKFNPWVSEKYFVQSQNATTGFEEAFKAQKDPNTFRIFILGASTAVGFPTSTMVLFIVCWLTPDAHFSRSKF